MNVVCNSGNHSDGWGGQGGSEGAEKGRNSNRRMDEERGGEQESKRASEQASKRVREQAREKCLSLIKRASERGLHYNFFYRAHNHDRTATKRPNKPNRSAQALTPSVVGEIVRTKVHNRMRVKRSSSLGVIDATHFV